MLSPIIGRALAIWTIGEADAVLEIGRTDVCVIAMFATEATTRPSTNTGGWNLRSNLRGIRWVENSENPNPCREPRSAVLVCIHGLDAAKPV